MLFISVLISSCTLALKNIMWCHYLCVILRVCHLYDNVDFSNVQTTACTLRRGTIKNSRDLFFLLFSSFHINNFRLESFAWESACLEAQNFILLSRQNSLFCLHNITT
jgi:hypothetical protein